MVEVGTLAEALTAIGHPGLSSSRRPVLRTADATLLTLATLDREGAPVWHGIWIDAKSVRPLGQDIPPSLLVEGSRAPPATIALVGLLQAAYRSYVEWLEVLGGRLDALEGKPDPAPLPELGALLHALAGARKQIVRMEILVAELDGALGEKFQGLEAYFPRSVPRCRTWMSSLPAWLRESEIWLRFGTLSRRTNLPRPRIGWGRFRTGSLRSLIRLTSACSVWRTSP